MSNPLSLVKNTWCKNWPEVHCGLTGGLPRFIFSRAPKPIGDSVPVFCYHVIDEPTFRSDLAFLTDNGYTTLTADALLAHLQQKKRAPENCVVLSFDDGQQTLHNVAYPLLKEFGHKAVAFICPGLHRDETDIDAEPAGGLCSWQQIHTMHASGHIDFQPHTDSHRYIPDWPRPLPLAGVEEAITDKRRPDHGPLEVDLHQAKTILDQKLGKQSQHLAFPQYYGTNEAIQTARALGYNAFWWGVLPHRPINRPSDPTDRIVRISGEFVRRLPGNGRIKLSQVLKNRYGKRYKPA